MSNPQKAKGDQAEREAAAALTQRLGLPVRRKLGAGRADDCGDLDGIPDTCVQVKNYRDLTRAVREILADLPTQQANAGATFAFGMARRPGGRWVVVMDLDQLATYIREATQETPTPMPDNPFKVGETVHMKQLPPGVADVTVTALGECDDQQGDGSLCGQPTVWFNDPQSGEPDEGHASDFELVTR